MKLRVIFPAAVLVAVVAACGGADPGASDEGVASLGTSAPADDGEGTVAPAGDEAAVREDALVEYARCMREHGIDMPDPQVDAGGGGFMVQMDGELDPGEMEEAQEVCQPIMEQAFGEMEPPSPEEVEQAQQQMLDHARCMREHGIDMPDPVIDAEGRIMMEGPMLKGDDPATRDKLDEAMEACSPGDGPGIVLESGPEEGDGPSFGFSFTPDGDSAP